MRLDDMAFGLREFWKEFSQVKSGLVGLLLLLIFIAAVFLEPSIIPFAETGSKWRDISYWDDNPQSAPPVWIDLFSLKKHARTARIIPSNISSENHGDMNIQKTGFSYKYASDIPPLDIIVHGTYSGNPVVNLFMERPDGLKVELLHKPLSAGVEKEIRLSIDKDAKKKAYTFGLSFDRSLDMTTRDMIVPTRVFFARAKNGIFTQPEALKGNYTILLEAMLPDRNSSLKAAYILLPGSVSGILGTDSSKRDLWSGIIAGVKWALLIGLMTAFFAVAIGVVFGVMCAYWGGWRDSLMQRIFEIFLSVPFLALLIVLSAVFQPNIWTLIILMSCFFWVGPVKTVRSIGLQIKEEVYIEASRSLGASSMRIIFKHMVPLLIPYSFASMALYVPGAIVYESSISLLGLGDSTIVTWGQILHDALTGGAVINGQWWWVVPPGLAIALMGMTFAFIGFAMDKILHPKLRTR